MINQVNTLLKIEKKCEEGKSISINGVKYNPIIPGDIIKFGKYPQENHGSISPIEWIVLDVQGNEFFLISRYGLDFRSYHHYKKTPITWEDCSLRKWLNDDFVKSAFSDEEIKKIKFSELKNSNNPQYNAFGGNDTLDRVFCLSITEVEQYLRDNENRKSKTTNYSKKNNFFSNRGWWLRTLGYSQYYATYVNSDGELRYGGEHVYFNFNVRPALRIICNL